MNLDRANYMLRKMDTWDKNKMRIIVSILEPATDAEVDAVKAIAETFGWKDIEVKVTPKPCTGISVKVDYINPEDVPKMEPGKIYA